jgi:hypothetical protein
MVGETMAFLLLSSTYKKTFELFQWSNLRLFLLVSAKTLASSLALYFSKFWWLLLLVEGVRYASFFVGGFAYPIFELGLVSGLYLLSCFIYMLVVRPSLEKKDSLYLMNYSKKYFEYSLFMLASLALLTLVALGMLALPLPIFLQHILANSFYWCLSVVGVLFLLDNSSSIRNSVQAFVRGVLAYIYFFPFFFAVLAFEYVLKLLFRTLLTWIVSLSSEPSAVLINIVSVALYAWQALLAVFVTVLLVNFYVRIKHAHYPLFFK